MTQRRRDIQGLRGLAVALVVLYHVDGILPGGFVGVDVFFVVSGFVIAQSLFGSWGEAGRVDLVAFYGRRVRRLLPALSLVVSATVVGSLFLESPNGAQQETAKVAIGASTAVANLVLPLATGGYFADGSATQPLLHTWSLSVEEQFYLVVPGLLGLMWWLERRNAGLPLMSILVVGLGSASLGLAVASEAGWVSFPAELGTAAEVGFFSPLTRAWEFLVGVLLALVPRRSSIGRTAGWWAGGVGLLAILGGSVLLSGDHSALGLGLVPVVAGTALLVLAGERTPSAVRGLVGSAPLVWLGDRSYSWYLWHWPMIVLLGPSLGGGWGKAAAAGLSLLPATLSHRWIEEPFRQMTDASARRTLAILAVSVMVPLGLALGLAGGATRGWGMDWPLGTHEVVRAGCDSGEFDPEKCTWGDGEGGRSVLLAGDSQSWALAGGLIDALVPKGTDLTVASRNACPFVAGPFGRDDDREGCRHFRSEVIAHASSTRPDLVVLANWSLDYLVDDEPGRLAWEEGLLGVIEPLRAAGLDVVLVGSYPTGDGVRDGRSMFARVGGDRWTDAMEIRSLHASSRDVERRAIGRLPGAVLFDPFPSFCEEQRCRTAVDGVEYYTDPKHLSVVGSRLLAADLMSVLEGRRD